MTDKEHLIVTLMIIFIPLIGVITVAEIDNKIRRHIRRKKRINHPSMRQYR